MNLTAEQCWQILVDRQPQDDFVYGVLSTGIVCRTGCPSRRPKQENVRFFVNVSDAVQAGYRPCKRCIDSAPGRKIVAICECIETSPERSLTGLAEEFGLSLRQMQRLFRQALGISPKQYVLQVRYRKFLSEVEAGLSVTDAVYAAGFPSSSRMYEQISERVGMQVAEIRAGGEGLLLFYAVQSSSLGEMIIAQTLKGLCFAGIYADPAQAVAALEQQFPKAERLAVKATQLEPIGSAMSSAMAGDYNHLAKLPLHIQGTAFQGMVWDAVRKVPVGTRLSYQQLAARLGKPKHARAVARALAANKIALAIPCHRIVPAAGGDGGYRWGTERKRMLLEKESSG